MEQKKARKAGIMDILRSPYAHRFFKKYKWSYLLGMAILIVIDSAQTEVPRIVGQVIDGIKYTTIDESGFKDGRYSRIGSGGQDRVEILHIRCCKKNRARYAKRSFQPS